MLFASLFIQPAFADGKINFEKNKYAALETLKSSSIDETSVLGYSEWAEAWTEKYSGSHLAYFPIVPEAVGYNSDTKDKIDYSRVSICYLSTTNLRAALKSSNESEYHKIAIAGAFFLWSTEAWSEDYAGVDPQEILGEYRYRWMDRFSPRRAAQLVDRKIQCDGYFGEVDAAKIFFEKYLQNQRVISRNAENDDWELTQQISFIPKYFFADAAATLRGFEDNDHRLAFLSGYSSVREWETAKEKDKAALKLATKKRKQLEEVAATSLSEFDQKVEEGFFRLKAQFEETFKNRLPYKDPSRFLSGFFRENSIFTEAPNTKTLNVLDDQFKNAISGLFHPKHYQKPPYNMLMPTAVGDVFGDLVCRSSIKRRDIRQFFSDYHLFAGGTYNYKVVGSEKNYKITRCDDDSIHFDEHNAGITAYIAGRKSSIRWPKEIIVQSGNAVTIPREWYGIRHRDSGIAGKYIRNSSRKNIILPIGLGSTYGDLYAPSQLLKPSDGGLISFKPERCQSLLEPLQKYFAYGKSRCHIYDDISISAQLSQKETEFVVKFGWKMLRGKRYLTYTLGFKPSKKTEVLNDQIYESQVSGTTTDKNGNKIQSDWQLMPNLIYTEFGDPSLRLNSRRTAFDVQSLQIVFSPLVKGGGVIISPRLELLGSEVKSSSGWPRGEPSRISVSSSDNGKLLNSILNHVGKFYSQ